MSTERGQAVLSRSDCTSSATAKLEAKPTASAIGQSSPTASVKETNGPAEGTTPPHSYVQGLDIKAATQEVNAKENDLGEAATIESSVGVAKRPIKRLKKLSGGFVTTRLDDSVENLKHVQQTAEQGGGHDLSEGSREDNTAGEDGFGALRQGDWVGNAKVHYVMESELGQGAYGKVFKCRSSATEKLVAIKISRANARDRATAWTEYGFLKQVKNAGQGCDQPDRFVQAYGIFGWRNHACLVLECLGMSLWDFLRENSFEPFPRKQVREFARQLFDGVAFLKDHGIIHTDLKPENILLTNDAFRTVQMTSGQGEHGRTCNLLFSTEIRIIDFGLAVSGNEEHHGEIGTAYYRAPEVLLEIGWSFPADVFAVGCIAMELYTGRTLFRPTGNPAVHLAQMEAVIHPMPPSLATAGRRKNRNLFKPNSNRLKLPVNRLQNFRYSQPMATLSSLIRSDDELDSAFLDLLEALLCWKPTNRMTARRALESEYFQIKIPAESEA